MTGKPIQVSCAYSGRVAVAYRLGGVKSHTDDPNSKFVNLCVSIYECESSGELPKNDIVTSVAIIVKLLLQVTNY